MVADILLLSFRWVKDGEAFGTETQGSGTLQADQNETLSYYQGFYRCYASNTLGTAMTRVIQVIVESQPVLLKQQKVHKRAYEGESIILSCNPPESSTPPLIHWMDKKMVHIRQSERVIVGLDGNLYFANLLKTDSRDDYICNAQYAAARTVLPESAVTLTVMPSNDVLHGKKPHLFHPTGLHSSVMALKGDSVTLECIPKGLPTPKVEWKKKDGKLDETSGQVDNHGRWLYFDSITQNDDGEYECRAFNSHGSTSHSFSVSVEASPYWVKEPQNLLYSPGETVRLDCQAEGIPTPTVTWSMNGQPITGTVAPRRSVSGGVLRLMDVEFGDTAVYQCEATNKHGSILTNTYLHVVELPPQILSSDGVVYKVTEGGDIKMHYTQRHTLWAIEMLNVSHDDSGVYTCSIKDANISINAYLEVFDRTVILTSPQNVRALRGSTVLLDCRFSKDSKLHEYQIVWRKDGSKIQESSPDDEYTIFENGTLKVTNLHSEHTGNYSCEVITSLDHVKSSGSITVVGTFVLCVCVWEEWKKTPGDFSEVELKLQPFCTYRFRIIAVNELGHSEPSKPSEHFSTPPAVPYSNPSGVRSDSKDPGTLIISWDEMDKRFHHGQGFQYKVFWREADGKGVHWNHGYTTGPPFLINNTGTYTPFEIKVQAVNSLGEGPAPVAEIGHSGEDLPMEAPSGVSVTVMNSTVRVKWNEAQKVRGLLLGYKRLERPEQEERIVVVHGMKTSEEVPGLRLFSQYELSVTVFNSKGEGPRSKVHPFNTPEGAPGPPASLTFESPTDKSLILYWTPPIERNGILLGYIVQYQEEVDNIGGEVQMQFISDPSVTHLELKPLDPSSYYIFNVMARTAAGDGPPITRRGATLLDGVPPSNITMFSGDTYVNLSWVPGERDRNYAFHISFTRLNGGGIQWQNSEVVNSTQGFYTLTGLQPGTDYHLAIFQGNSTPHWQEKLRTNGPELSEMPGGFATQGWFIGLISAVVLLVLILLILCLIKRSKGGKYAVKDKEDKEVDSEARPMKDETFGEYSDADEKRSDSQPSLCGDSKLGSDDSLAEYGDSVDIQFNEDGSFIGQYSGRGPVPHGNESSGPASPVNAVPPPPIAPSMSTILNRPS
uniref:Neural cell adhesion molecule L1.1 n=1 Tax=Sphaeramia orbicularis TaxID=375764 RepID=A0A673A4Y5_9TELE